MVDRGAAVARDQDRAATLEQLSDGDGPQGLAVAAVEAAHQLVEGEFGTRAQDRHEGASLCGVEERFKVRSDVCHRGGHRRGGPVLPVGDRRRMRCTDPSWPTKFVGWTVCGPTPEDGLDSPSPHNRTPHIRPSLAAFPPSATLPSTDSVARLQAIRSILCSVVFTGMLPISSACVARLPATETPLFPLALPDPSGARMALALWSTPKRLCTLDGTARLCLAPRRDRPVPGRTVAAPGSPRADPGSPRSDPGSPRADPGSPAR